MRIVGSALFIALFCGIDVLLSQQPPTSQMLPSEVLTYSTAPFVATRAQPDDLTQADLFAFGIGVARASQGCHDLEPTLDKLADTPNELLAMARLCNVGRQYDIARRAAERYLQIPKLAERETAFLALVQSSLGLNNPVSAAMQLLSLEGEFPYDPQNHFAADEVILAGALMNDDSNSAVLGLCTAQLTNSLPLLENGKGLEGKDTSVAAGRLFTDAVRCFEIARNLNESSATSTLARLQTIAKLPAWRGTAQLETMQSSLARAEMAANPAPELTISGELVRATGPLSPLKLNLAHGTNLLIPFTLWSPAVFSIVPDLHLTSPLQQIYLLTSWTANTGSADAESKEVLDSLRSAAQPLPVHVSILVVPDRVLQQFHANDFPAAIVIRDGIVRANLPLVGDAGKRMTLFALGPVTHASGSQNQARSQTTK